MQKGTTMTTNVDDITERLHGRTLSTDDAAKLHALIRSRTTERANADQHTARAVERFFTASEHGDVVVLRDLIVQLGAELTRRVPQGRNLALALTALEDVQMRGNRGIFAPEHLR